PEKLAGASVALHSTGSRLVAVLDQLLALVESGLDVISTCEELAWPWFHHADQARILDRAARRAGTTVVGTGVNPGFVMDLLPIVLTGVCTRVDHVYGRRVVDASRRRGPLQRKIGSGLEAGEFRRLAQEGRLGHVGLPESAALVGAGLGWRLDRIDNRIEPVPAEEAITTEHVSVKPGQVQGLHQVVVGLENGRERVRLDLCMALKPPALERAEHLAGAGSFDLIRITGDPPLELVIPGGIFGDTATVAAVTNAIPRVIEAPPGLLSVKDLPPAPWWRGRI
ncbi:MAG: dihydrodipicolinate reductase, partial [Bacillota bacterium]